MNSSMDVINISFHDVGSRFDEWVARSFHIGRRQAVKMIEDGYVLVNKKKMPKGYLLQSADLIQCLQPIYDAQKMAPVAQPELPLSVLYETDEYVVVNKPPGYPTHPLKPLEMNTFASALVARYPECASASEHAREGGFCHRLDTCTSGALIAARNHEAWLLFRKAFSDGTIEKEYLALCHGIPQTDRGEIKQPLLPSKGKSDRVVVADTPEKMYHLNALSAHTKFVVLATSGEYSLIRVVALTGRRHQIRAHLSYIGLPLCGDTLYGGNPVDVNLRQMLGEVLGMDVEGQFLHAYRLVIPKIQGLSHKMPVDIQAPLPEGRQKLLSLLHLDVF